MCRTEGFSVGNTISSSLARSKSGLPCRDGQHFTQPEVAAMLSGLPRPAQWLIIARTGHGEAAEWAKRALFGWLYCAMRENGVAGGWMADGIAHTDAARADNDKLAGMVRLMCEIAVEGIVGGLNRVPTMGVACAMHIPETTFRHGPWPSRFATAWNLLAEIERAGRERLGAELY